MKRNNCQNIISSSLFGSSLRTQSTLPNGRVCADHTVKSIPLLRRFPLIYSFLFLALLVNYSCNEEPVRTSLNAEERKIYDSLNIKQGEFIRKYTDSLCLVNRDSLYDFLVDSLLNVRILEIENLVKDEE